MKFLIFTCSTGGGHHSTAAAIAEYLTAQGHSCITKDCLDFLSPVKAGLIREGHIFLYRYAPKLFGMGYRREESHTPNLILRQCDACAEAFCRFVREAGCDAMINVHVFPALMMTAAKQRLGLNLPGYFVATDFTCSPGVGETQQDAYFIPHQDLTPEFVCKGLPQDRIIPSGIPVQSKFCSSMPKIIARQSLGLPEEKPLVLLTCGSMGAGPMKKLAQLLDRQLPPEAHLLVLCATNQKLKKQLGRLRLSSRIHVEGFVPDMSICLDAADLILTKAGGLATTEALMKRLPLVYIDAVPGCETHNRAFLTAHGCAFTADTPHELAAMVSTLIQDPIRLERLRSTMCREFPTPAAEILYHHLKTVHHL